MKVKTLIRELLKRESKKKQVNAAQMSEVVSKLADIFAEDRDDALKSFFNLYRLGKKNKKSLSK